MAVERPDHVEAKGRTVLWIDDEIAGDHALRQILANEGICISVAKSGSEGLAMAQAGTYDGIIVDLRLPDLFGLTIVRRLAERESTPIAVISGYYAEPEIQTEAIRLGAVRFIFKPLLGVEQILTLLDRADAPAPDRLSAHHGAAVGSDALTHCDSRSELIAIAIRALLDRRRSLLVFLGWADAVRLALTDANAAVPVLRSKMRHLIASAEAHPATGHPKTQQIISEIERGGTRQQERSLAKRYNVSRWHLSRMIYRQTGRFYSDLIRAAVIRAAISEVIETDEHFSQIAYARGYQHLSQFDHDFSVTFGCSPREFRRTANVFAVREDNFS